jgi:hypothetical protein
MANVFLSCLLLLLQVLTLKLDTKYWPSWELRRDPGKCTWTRHLIGISSGSSSSGLELAAGSAAAAAAAGGGGSAVGLGDAGVAAAVADDGGAAAGALGLQPMAM